MKTCPGGSFTQSESEFDSGSVDTLMIQHIRTNCYINGRDGPLNIFKLLGRSTSIMVPSYAGGERYTRTTQWRDARTAVLIKLSIEELILPYFPGWRSADGQWDVNVFVKNMLDDVDQHLSDYYSEYGMPGFSGLPSSCGIYNRGGIGFQVTFNPKLIIS